MTEIVRHTLPPRTGFRSTEIAWFVSRLDDLTGVLYGDLADIAPAELAWQPAPGFNTIGMLLAHLAVVETSWIDGRELIWFHERMRLARAHTVVHRQAVADATLTRFDRRTRRNGQLLDVDLGWVPDHLVEHHAGHGGQVLLLRHLYRARSQAPAAAAG